MQALTASLCCYVLLIGQDAIKSEEAKFEQWHAENRRRQHNWIPFIMEAIQVQAPLLATPPCFQLPMVIM